MFTRCMFCKEKSIETMEKSIVTMESSMKTMEKPVKTLGKSMNTMEKPSKTMEKIDEQCKWQMLVPKSIQQSTCFCPKM